MSNFVRVRELPVTLEKGEFSIPAVSFLNFIEANKLKMPKGGLVTTNYLREIISSVGLEYIGEEFDPTREINLVHFKGRPFASNMDVNNLLIELFEKEYPTMLRKFVEYHIKKRPQGTNMIYYKGHPKYATVFLEYGIHEILERDLDKHLGKKPKKVVGKPAITNEEAELQKNNA